MTSLEQAQEMTLAQFVEACEAHEATAERFFATEPTECHDLDITLVAALIDHQFPNTDPLIILSQEDFTMLLTEGIQIGYTLARRVDAGTLVAETTEGSDGEAATEAAASE